MDIFAGLDQKIAENDIPVIVPIYQQDGSPYVGLDGNQSTITVVGPESKIRKDYDRADLAKSLARQGEAPEKATPETIRAERVARACVHVVGWSGWDDGANDVPFSTENVRAVFNKALHILNQTEVGIARHAAFLSAAKAS